MSCGAASSYFQLALMAALTIWGAVTHHVGHFQNRGRFQAAGALASIDLEIALAGGAGTRLLRVLDADGHTVRGAGDSAGKGCTTAAHQDPFGVIEDMIGPALMAVLMGPSGHS